MAIIVKKMFAGTPGIGPAELDFAVAAVSAAPNVANLTSFIWEGLAHGRKKVQFISRLQVVTCACVVLVAFIPLNLYGLFALTALIFISRAAWTGVITVRTAVWRNNYPRANRTLIAGKMAMVQAVVLALAGLIIGEAMDIAPESFRYLYPVLALAGFVGNAQNKMGESKAKRDSIRDDFSHSCAKIVSMHASCGGCPSLDLEIS